MSFDRTGLLEYQVPAVDTLLTALKKHPGALDGSDMGTGKTFTAGAVIRARKLPTLVVCPAVSISGWKRMGNALGVRFSILNYEMLRSGRSDFGRWEYPAPAKPEKYFQCESCQIKITDPADPAEPRCPHHHLGIHCLKIILKPHNYGKFIFSTAVRQAVFDEVHRCAALDSLQSDVLLATRRQNISVLGCSATAAETPLDFRALGYAIGLHSYTDFFKWAARRGCRRTTWGGFQFLVGDERKRQIMAELHAEIFPERGARIRILDLGDSFPPVQITAELYDLQEAGRIDRLYAAMDDAIVSLNAARTLDQCSEHPLTVLLRARQEIELLKVPIYEELVAEALAAGRHVAIFVNFRQTVDELCRRLKTECRIDGSQIGEAGARRRRANVDAFQSDAEPVIVASNDAGGISIDLHDTKGNFPRTGLVSLGYSARGARQVFGRLRRALARSSAQYRIILAAGTVEEKVHRAVAAKLNCLDALNDEDLFAANIPLTKHSISDIFPERD